MERLNHLIKSHKDKRNVFPSIRMFTWIIFCHSDASLGNMKLLIVKPIVFLNFRDFSVVINDKRARSDFYMILKKGLAIIFPRRKRFFFFWLRSVYVFILLIFVALTAPLL